MTKSKKTKTPARTSVTPSRCFAYNAVAVDPTLTTGKFIAAICLNLDISLFGSFQRVLTQLITPDTVRRKFHGTFLEE